MKKILDIIIIIMVTVTMSRCGDVSDANGETGGNGGGNGGGIAPQPVLTWEGAISDIVTITADDSGSLTSSASNSTNIYVSPLYETTTLTLQTIYAVEVNGNAITLFETNGTQLQETYYVKSIVANTITLTTAQPATTYTLSAQDNILTVTSGTDTVTAGYITNFENDTLTLTSRDTINHTANIIGYSLNITDKADGSTQEIDNYEVENINENIINMANTDLDSDIYYTRLSYNGELLTILSVHNVTLMIGYILEVETNPGVNLYISLDGGSEKLYIRSSEEDIIVPNSYLTIENINGELFVTKRINDNNNNPITETRYVNGYLNKITRYEYDQDGNITHILIRR